MKATALARSKEVRDDGTIIEVVIWQLPKPLPPSAHPFKYRLYYGTALECRVRYDNEREARVIIATLVVANSTMSSLPLMDCSTISSEMLRTGVQHEGNH